MSNGASITIKNVCKSFDNVQALKNISLQIEPGEFVTLLGPSGSGKTTALMIIAGFEHADSGQILIDGQEITKIPAYKRDLGMVFQHYSLFPHMNISKNIAFPLEMRHISPTEIQRRVQSALDLVELPDVGNRYPNQLSGGQQQRIALARALVFNPRVLLMDEPLSALDRKLRERMQLEIKRIQKTLGITVLFVTHDQEEALTMSDKIVVMRTGSIEQIGGPKDIYENPGNKYVAKFLGDSNFFDGIVQKISAASIFVRLTANICLKSEDVQMVSVLSANDPVTLSIRPEKINLCRTNGFFCGTVKEIIFCGHLIKYFIELDGGKSIYAVKQNSHQEEHFAVSENVWISWDPTDAKVVLS